MARNRMARTAQGPSPTLFALLISFPFLSGLGAAQASELKENKPLVLIRSDSLPNFSDDSNLDGLIKSIEHSLAYYGNLPQNATFYFGQDPYTAKELAEGLEEFRSFLLLKPGPQELQNFIRDEFLAYRSVGNKEPVIFSAYYEHTLKAAFSPTNEYRYPIYKRPPDLVDAFLENFDPRKKGERIVGRTENGRLVPYYTREEIDSARSLKGKNLEIAWAKDPLDISFLQIQGSGWIRVPNSAETYHIRYAGDNGRPFRSIGTYLIETGAIPKNEFNRSKLIEHMKNLSEAERQKVLNQNPRYIFFEILSSTNLTRGSLLVPLTAGRTIASDPKLYPQGALAWIQTKKPLFDSKGTFAGAKTFSQFVLNQDEGGAIKGPARIDFFLGGGEEAERTAQRLWYPGELYFFVKKH